MAAQNGIVMHNCSLQGVLKHNIGNILCCSTQYIMTNIKNYTFAQIYRKWDTRTCNMFYQLYS